MKIEITKEYDGLTVLALLSNKLSLSHKAISRLKRLDNGIMLNSERVTVRALLREGDTLCLECNDRDDERDPYLVPVYYPLDILYEDEDIIVPNKPHSMPMHTSLGHTDDCLANALAYYFNDQPFIFRAVNRLDRDTSGACIIAKNRHSAMLLSKQIADKKIVKTYNALLEGTLDSSEGEIIAPIRRMSQSIITREICQPNDEGARYAHTVWKLISEHNGMSFVECMPLTGRTHQLRVHFSSISHPIVGDTLYGNESPLISRQALHASSIIFTHPTGGKEMKIIAPLPPDIQKILDQDNL